MSPQVALPDVNAQTYPYDQVQYLLDQTASFSMFATPAVGRSKGATLTPGNPDDFFGINGGYGIDFTSDIRRFDSSPRSLASPGFSIAEGIGMPAGAMHCQILFGPSDFPWAPSGEPFSSIFDPWRAQRFALKRFDVDFGRNDVCSGYGVGRTYPCVIGGRPVLLATAMGNVMDGRGKFAGVSGSFTFSGRITAELGFIGSVTLRIVDPDGRVRSDREVSDFDTCSDPEPDATFIVMRLTKKSSAVKTTYGPPPGPGLVSLMTPSQIRTAQFGFSSRAGGGLRTELSIGQVIGHMDADVHFDLLAPPGTAERPVPFTTKELYTFTAGDGSIAGTVSARVEEGEAFNLSFPAAPGQPGVRFAGVGPIDGGTGVFAGAVGTLTVNSVIGISPHALSLVHVLQIRNAGGQLRSRTS